MGATEFKKQSQSNRIKENYFTFLKVNCGIFLIITIFCSSLAFIYGAIHFTTINSNDKECLPENLLIASSSCICLFGDRRKMTHDLNTMISNNNGSNGEIRNVSFNETSAGFEIHYRDLSCSEVVGIWYYVILGISLIIFFFLNHHLIKRFCSSNDIKLSGILGCYCLFGDLCNFP